MKDSAIKYSGKKAADTWWNRIADILKDTLIKIELEKPDSNELLDNIEKIHSTEMGIERIKKNLNLEEMDVIAWCKKKVSDPQW